MAVVILHNPSSGRGRAALLAEQIAESVAAGGRRVRALRSGDPAEHVKEVLKGASQLVVVGGDGTVHHALSAAAESGAAILHVPTGTENLFAREFGMTPHLPSIMECLERNESERMDLGRAGFLGRGERLFSIMLSIGPDASVVRRLSAARKGPITHFSYLPPIAAEVFRIHLPKLSIEVDGRIIAKDRRGMAVVANMRQYGWRLDIAPGAQRADGLLDVAFLPAEGALSMLAWIGMAKLGWHSKSGRFISGRGERIRIVSDDPAACWQADGEAGDRVGQIDVVCEVIPGALRVLRMDGNPRPGNG